LKDKVLANLLTFIVEAVDSVQGGDFVIAAEQEEVERKFQFIAEEKENGLKTIGL
jgi:hypothetical protein